jgi:SAM-dependent methyltransferase
VRCAAEVGTPDWACRACGFVPSRVAGFPAFAPDLSASNEGFNAVYFGQLRALEAGNYWFRARNALVLWALRTYFVGARTYLEVGCGTGFVLQGIAEAMPQLSISAGEVSGTALPYAASRVPRAEILQMDARAIPFADHFDVVGLFDVIEHVEDDLRVLKAAARALHAGGGLLITVPQHSFLWSRFDERAMHVRRYAARELRDKITAAGFEVVMMTSYVSLLLPLMMLSRWYRRRPRPGVDDLSEMRIGRTMNAALEAILSAERRLIVHGARFPAGGSLLVVARRAP